MLDIGVASEDALKVNPLTLDINPHVKEHMYSVELVFPSHSFFLKLFVVGGVLHSLK